MRLNFVHLDIYFEGFIGRKITLVVNLLENEKNRNRVLQKKWQRNKKNFRKKRKTV